MEPTVARLQAFLAARDRLRERRNADLVEVRADRIGHLDEPLHECERRVGDVAPTALGVLRVASPPSTGSGFADAAWKIGLPGPGTEYVSYSSFASSSETAFANAYRSWSYVSGTARL